MSDKILRPREVVVRTGHSRTTLWRKVKAGKFPAPKELGPNSIGWLESDIDTWLANLPTRTYGVGDGARKEA